MVAEGVSCPGGGPVVRQIVGDSPDPVRLGGVGLVLANALEGLVPFEVRYVVLGHVQRGGSPTPFDRILATRFGAAAAAVLADGESGRMVALQGARIERVPLADVLSRPHRVDPQGERVAAARGIGTIFGTRPERRHEGRRSLRSARRHPRALWRSATSRTRNRPPGTVS